MPVASERNSVSCGHRYRTPNRRDSSAHAYADSCPACRMFGSLKFGGRFSISDTYPIEGRAPPDQPRNGVGIDRFTGGTVSGELFDLLVLVGGEFETKIRLVNFELWQLAALGLLLTDLADEMIQIGSGRSRGLGRVRGEVISYRLTYVQPVETVQGLYDLADAEERTSYHLHRWALLEPIGLPGKPVVRGLRSEYDMTSLWAEIQNTLTPAFENLLEWMDGLHPPLVNNPNH